LQQVVDRAGDGLRLWLQPFAQGLDEAAVQPVGGFGAPTR
jgi:hypothetical protein